MGGRRERNLAPSVVFHIENSEGAKRANLAPSLCKNCTGGLRLGGSPTRSLAEVQFFMWKTTETAKGARLAGVGSQWVAQQL